MIRGFAGQNQDLHILTGEGLEEETPGGIWRSFFFAKTKTNCILRQRETNRREMQEEDVGTQNRQRGSRNPEPGKSHSEEKPSGDDRFLHKRSQRHSSVEGRPKPSFLCERAPGRICSKVGTHTIAGIKGHPSGKGTQRKRAPASVLQMAPE